MSAGGVVGAAGLSLPGVELAISLSVVVFVALVARQVRLAPGLSSMIVGFFAFFFFHGFAHGAEMPGSASIVTFTLGFYLATLLLHGLGLATARLAALALAFAVGGSAAGEEQTNAPASTPAPETKDGIIRMETVVMTGRTDSLIGIADSAAQGTVGAGLPPVNAEFQQSGGIVLGGLDSCFGLLYPFVSLRFHISSRLGSSNSDAKQCQCRAWRPGRREPKTDPRLCSLLPLGGETAH